MPTIDIPTLGTLVLCAVLVMAAYTFGVSIAAAGGRPHLLRSARFGTYATIALVTAAVFLLAYSFQVHDFRIRYVARYSDRSMSPIYLWAALWGGQDGSMLWWSFLMSLYIGGFTFWIKDRYRELQPAIFATLMVTLSFFIIVQLFAANPFATTIGAAPADGEGLNPLLQNYWMVIHPPALYLGLTGWTIPFALVVAALVTGRLGDEWVLISRRWVLLAWAFLSLGNMLGMFWSYEELGWGGYWAWDPVENASFFPWLTATAYLHSVMIQERRGILKVWNVGLLTTTFILTIFGTFLTRSGMIASVHSFARSDIGIYFAWYLVVLCIFTFNLVAYRISDLRPGFRFGRVHFAIALVIGIFIGLILQVTGVSSAGETRFLVASFPLAVVLNLKLVEYVRLQLLKIPPQSNTPKPGIESMLSREFAFLFNNWILLGALFFVILATTFPLLSEALRGETVTIGPGYYNKWMVPLGLILLLLSGIGPLIAWRRASGKSLFRAFRAPVAAAIGIGLLHLLAGESAGFRPFVEWEEIYDTTTGTVLAAIYSVAPLVSTTLCAFVLAAVAQEFSRGTAARMRSKKEGVLTAFVRLIFKARRRYGGYTVHVGVVLMFLGFTGAAYDQEREASLMPGESLEIGGYSFRYDDVRMEQDPNKRMVFADMTVLVDGEEITRISPAKFIYRTHPEMPTTEVAIRSSPLNDLYVIMSSVDPNTRRGSFRVIVRPLVMWIWLGGFVLLFGTFFSALPTLKEILGESKAMRPARAMAVASLLLTLGFASAMLVPSTANAQSDSSSSLHAGTVEIHDPVERRLFEQLLCECGDCQRLPLSTCGCSWAEGMRAEVRGRVARGDDVSTIVSEYRERFGSASIAIPADQGLDRALWAVPLGAVFLAAVALIARGRRFRQAEPTDEGAELSDADGNYDDQLEEELRALEGD